MNALSPAPDLVSAFTVNDTPAPEPTRNEKLQQLFITHYSTIREAVATEQTLLVGDIDNITAGVARHLDDYEGPAQASAFIEWAVELATESAQRLASFYQMRAEHSESVRKAIGSVLKGCAGLGISDALGEIEQDVWIRILSELPDWLADGYSHTPGGKPATLDTRLYGRAYWTARAWKTSRVRERERFADSEIIETSSDPTGACGRKVVCTVVYD